MDLSSNGNTEETSNDYEDSFMGRGNEVSDHTVREP